MVAPIDAKVSLEAEGETFSLRLNFRALALAKSEGVDLLSGIEPDPLQIATAVRCLAVQEHPNMTDDEAFALVVRHGDAVSAALTELFDKFGGEAGGNAKKSNSKKA